MKAILTWLPEGCDPGVRIESKGGIAVDVQNLLYTSLSDVLKKWNLTENDVVDKRW